MCREGGPRIERVREGLLVAFVDAWRGCGSKTMTVSARLPKVLGWICEREGKREERTLPDTHSDVLPMRGDGEKQERRSRSQIMTRNRTLQSEHERALEGASTDKVC